MAAKKWPTSTNGDPMSKKKEMKRVLRSHQPSGGGYGVAVQCSCGEDFSADHQIERVIAAWDEEDRWNAGAEDRYWAS